MTNATQKKAPLFRRLKRMGSSTIRYLRGKDRFPKDYTLQEIAIINKIQPYTLTSRERILTLIHAVRYITQNNIPGTIVECGVFKGGSMMAAAETLYTLGRDDRDFYLFDTFEDYCQPTKEDVSYKGESGAELLKVETRKIPTVKDVKKNFSTIHYPSSKIHYIKGRVQETLPEKAPDQIALLRLDTDWYESTKHEMENLFPRLVPGGVIIIDDYGHWQGSQKAVDEYLEKHQIPLFLKRIDYTGRVAVKVQ